MQAKANPKTPSAPPAKPPPRPAGPVSDQDWSALDALFGTLDFDPDFDPKTSRPRLT